MERRPELEVAVLGAGVMGHGIAEVAALSECRVNLYDIKAEFVKSAVDKIEWSLSKFVERHTITEEKAKSALSRITGTLDLSSAAKGADLIIEAAPEDLDVKKGIFHEVDRMAKLGAILASNTSTLPIGEIASSVKRPEAFVGMHFFNPPPLMPLLEVVKGERTSPETLEFAVEVGKRFGKDVVVCRKDVPGFIVNRILGPLLNEAAFAVSRREATVEAVDSMAVHGLGFPMGVFELADYSGIDTIYKAGLAVSSRDPSNTQVAPLFKRMVDEEKLGRKSGEGFYKYQAGNWSRPTIPKVVSPPADPVSIFAPAVNAAAWLLRNGVCSKDDLDKSVKLGLGFPEGILRMADKWGIDSVVASLRSKNGEGMTIYVPDPLLVQMVSTGALGEKSSKGFYDYSGAETRMEDILVKRAPPVGWVILNRPHRLNALTQKMMMELGAALRELDDDPSVRVVVIRGAGEKAFTSGADLSSFGAASSAKFFDLARSWHATFTQIETLGKPVVAAINGMAFGGGCELALSCDFRLASEDATIGLTETHLGLMPGAGGTQRLARIVGLQKAKEMVFLVQKLTAAEALEAGLVNRVYRKADFEREVADFATRLAKQPPLSLKFAKQALNLSTQVPTDLGQLFEAMGFGLLLSTQDANEGISALLEKREPEFKGE